MKLKHSHLLLIPAVFAVSWAAIIIRACSAPPVVIAFYRMFFSAALLAPFGFIIYRKNFREFSKRSFLITVIAGFFLGWHFFFWITSLNYTSIASSVVLVTTQPIFVAVLARIFLHEKIGVRGIVSITLALIGTALIAGFDFNIGKDYFWGDILALAGAIMAGLYLFIGRVVRPKLSVYPYILTVYGIASITLGIVMIITGDFKIEFQSVNYGYFLLLALGPTLIGHTLYNYSLRHIKAHKVGITIVGEPVLASIWAIFIFSEYPSISTIIGGIIIIIALVLVFMEKGQ